MSGETRAVGVRGLPRLHFDESELQQARRSVLDKHHVTESYAKWAAGVTGRRLCKMGLRELAMEREYLVSLATGPFKVTGDHLNLFVALVRAHCEFAQERAPREAPLAPRVKRVWKSLEMQRVEREVRDASRIP